jgi:predicted peroxiredoxin
MLIMMTSGPDTPTRLGTPFHQAMTAVALDAEEVTIVFTMEGTRLLDGAMGAAGYASMGLQDDVVVFCY